MSSVPSAGDAPSLTPRSGASRSGSSPGARGIAARAHVAPPQLLIETTNALVRASEGSSAAGGGSGAPSARPSDAASSQAAKRSRWSVAQKVKFGLAFRTSNGANLGEAGAREVWEGISSSEDEASIDGDAASFENDAPARGEEDEGGGGLGRANAIEITPADAAAGEDDDDENARASSRRASSVRARDASSSAASARELELCSAIPRRSDVTELVWSFQNLARVPPALFSADVGAVGRLTKIDLSRNRLTSVPSALVRLADTLVALDVSHNQIERIPPALGRCKKLRALAVNGNWLRRLGSWLCELPALETLRAHENPMVDPPPEITARGVDATREYLRAMRVIKRWDPNTQRELARFRRARGGKSESEEKAERAEEKAATTNGRVSASAFEDASEDPDLRFAPFKPAFFVRFKRLTLVDLRGARLSALPPAMAQCSCLETLDASENLVSDVPDLTACANLRTVVLDRCAIETVPAWISSHPGIRTLRIRRNKLRRFAVPDMRGCVRLSVLDVASNALRALPRLPSALRTLVASENNLESAESLCDATDLRAADLAGNKITALPEELAELTRLTSLDARRNLIRDLDASPGMARRAKRLEKLWVSNNPIGAMPWWLADCDPSALEPAIAAPVLSAIARLKDVPSHATALDLSDRGLPHCPSVAAFASFVTSLRLTRNRLGFLPPEIGRSFVSLEELHVDENYLAFLPDVQNMPNLKHLRAQSNRLVALPASVSSRSALVSLYVGDNPDLREIPDVSRLASLETLWMANCAVTSLPPGLASAPRLRNFYCEGNPLRFPGPEVRERGNEAILAFLRSVEETEREKREMERARREKEKETAGDARNANANANANALPTASDGVVPGGGVGGTQHRSVGALLWTRVRRVVLETSANAKKKAAEEDDPEDLVLRAKELKTQIKLANAEEAIAEADKKSASASARLAFAADALRVRVDAVLALREKAANQRRLMARYPSINEDALKTLQERLRDAKAELRHAADAVADADAHSASAAEAADALRSEAAETRGEAEAAAEARRARAEAKLVAKMSRRREEAEKTREAAEEGARDAEAAARAEATSLATRMASKRDGMRLIEGGRSDKAPPTRQASEHARTGMAAGDEAATRGAQKAWGRMQMLNRLGAFAGGAGRAEKDDKAETEENAGDGGVGGDG